MEQYEPRTLEWREAGKAGNFEVELIVETQNWLEISDQFDYIGRAALLAIRQSPCKAAPLAMKSPHRLAVLMLSDNATITQLNKTYRTIDKPTNVLSFPSTESLMPNESQECDCPESENQESEEQEPVHIGDVILAYDYVIEEAKQEKKQIDAHISHLVIHGVLHLLGYDHETDEDAEIMESLEKGLMNELNLPNPY